MVWSDFLSSFVYFSYRTPIRSIIIYEVRSLQTCSIWNKSGEKITWPKFLVTLSRYVKVVIFLTNKLKVASSNPSKLVFSSLDVNLAGLIMLFSKCFDGQWCGSFSFIIFFYNYFAHAFMDNKAVRGIQVWLMNVAMYCIDKCIIFYFVASSG